MPQFVLYIMIVGGLTLVTGAVGADDIDPLDQELLDALEGKPPADSPARIVPRLLSGTREVARRLDRGLLDDETSALQEGILADLDALLEQSSPPQGSQSPPPSDSRPPQSQQQDPSSQSDAQQDNSQESGGDESKGADDPDAPARESEERTAAGSDAENDRERRLGLSTAAWGHLPPKVREQMRSAFSEEYLPEYDAFVRRYYEAMARRRFAE